MSSIKPNMKSLRKPLIIIFKVLSNESNYFSGNIAIILTAETSPGHQSFSD